MIVLRCVTPVFLQLFNNYPSSFLVAWLVGFAVTISVTLALAALSYRYIETPSMALGKKFTT
jgi:peptidoglycan/LPS O-acetylase OafA/YrhL